MKLKTLIPETFSSTQWCNLFNLYKDKNASYFFNFFNSIQIPDGDMNTVYFDKYHANSNDNLFHISDRFYGTIDLWWMIAYANRIQDPFFIEGLDLKILKKAVVEQIINHILAN